jgi:hypothetical protein
MSASILKSRNADPPLELTRQTLHSTLESANSVDGTLEFAKRAGSFGTPLEKIGLAVHEIVANAVGETTVTLIKYIRQSRDGSAQESDSLPERPAFAKRWVLASLRG